MARRRSRGRGREFPLVLRRAGAEPARPAVRHAAPVSLRTCPTARARRPRPRHRRGAGAGAVPESRRRAARDRAADPALPRDRARRGRRAPAAHAAPLVAPDPALGSMPSSRPTCRPCRVRSSRVSSSESAVSSHPPCWRTSAARASTTCSPSPASTSRSSRAPPSSCSGSRASPRPSPPAWRSRRSSRSPASSGGQASVLRATVMGGLFLAASLLGRESRVWNSLAAALLVLLALDPGGLAEPGLQLSFAATAGLLHLGPWIRGVARALVSGTDRQRPRRVGGGAARRHAGDAPSLRPALAPRGGRQSPRGAARRPAHDRRRAHPGGGDRERVARPPALPEPLAPPRPAPPRRARGRCPAGRDRLRPAASGPGSGRRPASPSSCCPGSAHAGPPSPSRRSPSAPEPGPSPRPGRTDSSASSSSTSAKGRPSSSRLPTAPRPSSTPVEVARGVATEASASSSPSLRRLGLRRLTALALTEGAPDHAGGLSGAARGNTGRRGMDPGRKRGGGLARPCRGARHPAPRAGPGRPTLGRLAPGHRAPPASRGAGRGPEAGVGPDRRRCSCGSNGAASRPSSRREPVRREAATLRAGSAARGDGAEGERKRQPARVRARLPRRGGTAARGDSGGRRGIPSDIPRRLSWLAWERQARPSTERIRTAPSTSGATAPACGCGPGDGPARRWSFLLRDGP